MKGIVGIVVLVVVYVVAGFVALDIQVPRALWAEFQANRAKWESKRLLDYQYIIRLECLCVGGGGRVLIEVSGGWKFAGVFLDTNTPLSDDELASYPDIEGVFKKLKLAIWARDSGWAYEIAPEYDPSWGYPVYTGTHSKGIMDADVNYVVELLEPARHRVSAGLGVGHEEDDLPSRAVPDEPESALGFGERQHVAPDRGEVDGSRRQ